ncbi:RNA polymerase sigma factor [Pseudobacteroides cellulosolvens]|uniref:RNA polymerase sigma factor n=1 Tax=Pseudobacteroides cellulosolvens ATCC 35603 = DSM 2933 TaxID=398512 RepID=A0A0L6JJJ2_9FIRM|nr:RNA polymerase sigma factor [Pseudobacteroides cellulosolvens]KNY25577.1 RNA polymerase, sigma-24 subunit, RpoE, ECF subfamily [Pseudobacteroides cellulosolvens ATCC 35603 = DSM 2933]
MNRDNVLIENVLDGNTDSFSILVQCYQDQLYKFIYKLTVSKEDTEDILQEVFIRVYNNLYKYNNRWNFSTWLYNIAVNVFKTHYKKKKKNPENVNNEAIDDISCSILDYPDVAYEVKEQRLLIIKLINGLKDDQKIALVLKHVQGFSYKEIADILEVTPEAAKMKVQRAKQFICKKYNEMKGRGVYNEVHI